MPDRLVVTGRVRTGEGVSPHPQRTLLENGVIVALDLGDDSVSSAQEIELSARSWMQAGYVDDHCHLMAMAAERFSVDVRDCRSNDEVLATISGAELGETGWLRVVGYDDVLLDGLPLDRRALDVVTSSTPTVVHHLTGHLVIANSAACSFLGAEEADGILVERHDQLARVPRPSPDGMAAAVAEVTADMSRRGVVAATDATHTNDLAAVEFLADATSFGSIDLTAMIGADRLDSVGDVGHGDHIGHVSIGHAKVMPSVQRDDVIAARWSAARQSGFPVAVHVMDIDTLDVALSAATAHEPMVDRIEHCALALPEQLDRLATLGLAVATQPSFVTSREAKYRSELSDVELDWLWPLRSLLDRSIDVTFSSDGPTAASDPGEWTAAAANRSIGRHEQIDASRAHRCATGGWDVGVGTPVWRLTIGDGEGYTPLIEEVSRASSRTSGARRARR